MDSFQQKCYLDFFACAAFLISIKCLFFYLNTLSKSLHIRYPRQIKYNVKMLLLCYTDTIILNECYSIR